jgi:feruloyl esterase
MTRAAFLPFAAILVTLTSAPARAATCDELAKLALPRTAIDRAMIVAAGAFTPPATPGGRGGATVNPAFAKLPAFCRIAATIKPTNASDIKVEAWLPVSGWNGKFQGVGNGGWAGSISYPAMAAAVQLGYATASTDTGHIGGTAAFALVHPEKLVDFGHRAIHEMTVYGKAVAEAFYGSGPKASIFNGCSLGGRQAITEAMRYPADYNGIIAGAPMIYTMQVHVARIALNALAHRPPEGYIPQSKYAAVHEAVLNACDTLDGVKDGVLENPLACTFDPKVLECKGADSVSCLTPPQIDTMREMYASINTGEAGTMPPLLQPGTELGWATLAGEQPVNTALEAMKYIVFKDPQWTVSRFNLATDFDRAMKADGDRILGFTDPNLKPFFDRGGKLLMYHGWQDPQVPAQSSPRYFNEVLKTVGRNAAGSSIQLYMVPGMNHCGGGPGTDSFDKVSAIESFLATGKAPAAITASHLSDGKVDKTRPLCPFGQVARWKGTGSTNEAANFACVADAPSAASR